MKKECKWRHENGNCLIVGGFCTSVPKNICNAIHKAYMQGKNDSSVHAHWDDSADGITPFCTNCGRTHRCFNRNPDYCPHCGAKMDEKV